MILKDVLAQDLALNPQKPTRALDPTRFGGAKRGPLRHARIHHLGWRIRGLRRLLRQLRAPCLGSADVRCAARVRSGVGYVAKTDWKKHF